MTSLLVGTFVIFGIHTLLWLPRSFQALKHSRQLRKQAKGQKQFRRFNRLNRMLHITVIISFLTLAVTGMMLKFSYLPWAQWLAQHLGGFQSAGTLHRMGALLTFFYFIRHIYDAALPPPRRSGKTWGEFIFGPDGMMFNKRDGQEFVQTVKWFLHKGERPQYGRWTYWEKFDYFAVFWGVAMIGFSGLILWFPEIFTYVLPGWFINVATIIHSDEALLATGLHLHDPLLQHALPAGPVPHGSGDLHRPHDARGVQGRPAPRIRATGRPKVAWRSIMVDPLPEGFVQGPEDLRFHGSDHRAVPGRPDHLGGVVRLQIRTGYFAGRSCWAGPLA